MMSSSSYSTTSPSTGSGGTGSPLGGDGSVDLQPRTAAHAIGTNRGRAVDADIAGVDQVGRRRPRQPEKPGDRDVQAQPLEPVGNGQQAGFAHRRRVPSTSIPISARTRGRDGSADDRRIGGVEDRPDVAVGAEQADPVDDVTASRSGCPEDPVGEVADRPAQDQPERDRPADRPHPTGGARDHHDDGERDDRENERRTGADREGRPGVAGLEQVDRTAQQPHRGMTAELRRDDRFGDHVDGHHDDRDDHEQRDPVPGRRGLCERLALRFGGRPLSCHELIVPHSRGLADGP